MRTVNKIPIIIIALMLTGCSSLDSLASLTPYPTPTIGVWQGSAPTTAPLSEWLADQAQAGIPITPVMPIPAATQAPAVVTVIVQATPRPAVNPPTANPTADALRYRSTELALANLSADATRQAGATREAEVIAALQTRAAVTREAIRATAQAPTQMIADIAAPLLSVVCVLALALASVIITIPLAAFARARADLERSLSDAEHWRSRIIETGGEAYWIGNDGQPAPLRRPAQPTRFVTVNGATVAQASARDMLDFLDACIRMGGDVAIPSHGKLGMSASAWQALKDQLAGAKDAGTGQPMNWVSSGPQGTQLVGGWQCDTARDAIAGGEVVV